MILEAFGAESRRLSEVVAAADDAAFARPSPCFPWSVAELVHHVRMTMGRLTGMLAAPEAAGSPLVPAAAYYRADQRFSAATNADRIRSARCGAATLPGAAARARDFDEARQHAWALLQAAPPGRVVQTRHGDRMLLTEFLRTRVLELAVHGLDLAAALECQPWMTAPAAQVTEELLLKLNAAERVTWQGRFRPALNDAPISPRPAQGHLPIWVGTGGTPGSIVRAGALGLPLALANISIPPAQLAPVSDLYRRTGMEAGHDARDLKLSIATHMHVQENSQDALNEFYPHYAGYFRNHTPAHFRAQEISRADYEARASPHGALFVGSPQQIIDKILYERELFGHQRFLAQIDIGGLPCA